MSWKSIVSAGLLCVLASPALAAPTLRVTNGPALNAQGNWVWNVSIEPGSTTPVAAELGFTANRVVVGTPTKGAEFTGANTNTPGDEIFGWETATGSPPRPEGVQVEPIANDGTVNQVFSALGSITEAGFSGQTPYLTIVSTGPTNTAVTGDLVVSGSHGAGDNEGRIAEATGPAAEDAVNFRNFTGMATRTLQDGDVNLDGTVNSTDFAIFGGNWQQNVTTGWSGGDFNRDGIVNSTDFAYFGGNWQDTGGASISNLTVVGILDPPPGAGGGSAIPEPASMALVGLALLGGLGLFRRKR